MLSPDFPGRLRDSCLSPRHIRTRAVTGRTVRPPRKQFLQHAYSSAPARLSTMHRATVVISLATVARVFFPWEIWNYKKRVEARVGAVFVTSSGGGGGTGGGSDTSGVVCHTGAATESGATLSVLLSVLPLL
ncbi:hypothetical protein J6590_068619 [Homalodisca vitripennis]|nr:hypothetical protein J6590_068619 [Homalodisca vitripennis]